MTPNKLNILSQGMAIMWHHLLQYYWKELFRTPCPFPYQNDHSLVTGDIGRLCTFFHQPMSDLTRAQELNQIIDYDIGD